MVEETASETILPPEGDEHGLVPAHTLVPLPSQPHPATAIVLSTSTADAHSSHSSPSTGAGDHQRRRKISERAKNLFMRKVIDKKEVPTVNATSSRNTVTPTEGSKDANLPYQPRIKLAPALRPQYVQSQRPVSSDAKLISYSGGEPRLSTSTRPGSPSTTPVTKRVSMSGLLSLAPSPRARSPERQPPQSVSQRGFELPPSLADEAVIRPKAVNDADTTAPNKLPTITRPKAGEESASTSSPHTPRRLLRNLSMSRDKEGPRTPADLSPIRTHFHLHKPKLHHPSRKSSVDVNKRAARGQMNLHASEDKLAPRRLGSFPVAPSYHPNAHPTLQPPRVAFNIIDGPTSHNLPSSAEAPGTAATTPEHTLQPPRLQRPAIKIKIISWNMGGSSLPKGDLEVLLGRVGGYVPPDEGWDLNYESDSDGAHDADDSSYEFSHKSEGHGDAKQRRERVPAQNRGKGIAGQEDVPRHDRIPPLPYDDGHPYHLLVVAGQECPWGDGKRIATGLGVAGELSDLTRTKSKAQPGKAMKEGAVSSIAGTMDIWSPGLSTPKSFGVDEFPFGSPPHSAAASGVHAPAPLSKGLGGKGWSEVCEDWLCRGPAAQTQATKGLAATAEALVNGKVSSASASQIDSRSPRSVSPEPSRPISVQSGGDAASQSRSGDFESLSPVGGSPPVTTLLSSVSDMTRRTSTGGTLTVPRPAFGRANSTGTISSKSQVGRSSISSGNSVTTAAETLRVASPTAPIVKDFAVPTSPSQPADAAAVRDGARRQLQIQTPGQHSINAPHTIGAYELIAKERMAMVYCAVYVWRGCRDRIRGVSQGQVKSGMLAGRVGNKGAVGISVKLGRTRLLFVNSHLAAHEGKVQTRLDNVAKIKRELRVNTFLPIDDARNRLDDVTEMFDHAFWLGDLNFRVDITRQHADWLIMQRRYDQAIEFDQLRKVMKEGKEFNGFKEHPITFPPTYKYDVLKTLKKPKKEKTVRRILQRRDHAATNLVTSPADTADDPDLDSPIRWEAMSGGDGSGVALGDRHSTQRQEQINVGQMVSDRERERGGCTDDDASSVSSAAWDSSGFVGKLGLDSDEDISLYSSSHGASPVDPVVSSNTSAAQGGVIFSHGAAIKAKLRIMDLVRSATGGTGDQSAAAGARRKEKHRSREMSAGPLDQPTTPRSECHSPISAVYNGDVQLQASPRGSEGKSPGLLAKGLSTKAGASVPALIPRSGDDALRHQSSFASLALEQSSAYSARSMMSPTGPTFLRRRQSSPAEGDTQVAGLQRSESAAAANRLGIEAEIERQKYDTSAKQRVPSWTDRILWRSNVPVIPSEAEGMAGKMSKSLSAIKAAALPTSTRTSQRTSFPMNELAAMRKTSSIPRPQRSQTFSHPLSHSDRKFAEQEAGASDEADRFKDAVPQRERGGSWFNWHGPPKGGSPNTSLDLSSGQTSAELARSRSGSISQNATVFRRDGSAKHMSDLSSTALADSAGAARPRMPTTPKRTASAGHTSFIARPSYLRGPTSSSRLSALRTVSSPHHNGISGGNTRTSSPSTDAALENQGSPSMSTLSHDSVSSSNSGGGSGRHCVRSNSNSNSNFDFGPSSRRMGASWWSMHMPSILTAHGAAAALASLGTSRDAAQHGADPLNVDAGIAPPSLPPKVEVVGPSKGVVECLLYKSLDDREMRALEGRSDHRPVIWVGSCGV